jgi:hypothetical protein
MFTTPESSVLNWDAGPNETELISLAQNEEHLDELFVSPCESTIVGRITKEQRRHFRMPSKY